MAEWDCRVRGGAPAPFKDGGHTTHGPAAKYPKLPDRGLCGREDRTSAGATAAFWPRKACSPARKWLIIGTLLQFFPMFHVKHRGKPRCF